jgi:hypothetical protein
LRDQLLLLLALFVELLLQLRHAEPCVPLNQRWRMAKMVWQTQQQLSRNDRLSWRIWQS